MRPVRVDVAIAGGGPTGCAAAIRLARAGASVQVLERGDHARRLPGERLVPEAVAALAALDVQVDTCESPGTVSLWGDPAPVVAPAFLHPLGGGHAVTRPALDRAFADAAIRAGATVRTGARLRGVESGPDGWRLSVETREGHLVVHAAYLIDATGRAAALGRHVGATVERVDDLVAELTWVPAGAELADRFRMLHVEAIEGAWVYAIAGGDHTVTVGACALRNERRQDREGFLRGAVARSELLASFASMPWPTPRRFPAAPARSRPSAGPAWAAVGDAAAQLDPISGSGLRHGLETAFRAAEMAMLPPDHRDAIGRYYDDAVRAMHEEHRRLRAHVYAEAADRLGASFVARIDPYVSPDGAVSR